ncbi:MAG TPA: Phenylacetic acid catabolic protein [Chloroflexia bacterium]|nr:Phenylacetic acid catabolic protein [Chloroflexia bacterium]
MTIAVQDEREIEAQMMAVIESGGQLEKDSPMTADYRENLLNLMTMQADSELAGSYGYIPWIHKAPTIEEKLIVANIVRDEVLHGKRMYKLLEEMGVDVDSRIKEHDEAFMMRLDDSNANIGTERKASDKRVNIFYYPIDTWTDFIMFNFCMDRGSAHQLEDVKKCSYGPWARTIELIFKEEVTHIRHGDMWVEKLAKDPATHDDCQQTFNKWYFRTMNIFGRPGSSRNALYRKYRLKLRDNDEVRAAFDAEISGLAKEYGLTVPEWKPNW